MFTADEDKTNLLNDYFQQQTIINDDDEDVPVINDYDLVSRLNSIFLTADEIKLFLNNFSLVKQLVPTVSTIGF